MWSSYFFQIQSKYSMRVSLENPLVIRLDGKDVTKNKKLDLLNNYEGSFRNILERAVEHFSRKYHCFSIFGSDEVNFIFTEPINIIKDLDKEMCNKTNEIIALFAQYFFDYFNQYNNKNKIFWHAKCFSISTNKLKSYIKFRSGIIKNVMTTYFLGRNHIRSGKSKLKDKEEQCKKLDGYEVLEDIQDGILYYDGNRIDLAEFYKNNIKVIERKEDKQDIEVLDLFDF